MTTLMSEATRSTLLAVLGASSFGELLGREYQSLSRENDINRETHLRLYADRNRGSVRINSGRFYTVSEFEDRVVKLKALRLP